CSWSALFCSRCAAARTATERRGSWLTSSSAGGGSAPAVVSGSGPSLGRDHPRCRRSTAGAAAATLIERRPWLTPARARTPVSRELEAGLAGVLTLDLGVGSVELTGLRPPPPSDELPAEPPQEEATVIDRAVLAERRARRAELAEESSARRATDSEHALGRLE